MRQLELDQAEYKQIIKQKPPQKKDRIIDNAEELGQIIINESKKQDTAMN